MSGVDDPREILKAAGAECAEVEAWVEQVFTGEFSEMKTVPDAMSIIGPLREVVVTSNDAILALARDLAKFKWQRGKLAERLLAERLTTDVRGLSGEEEQRAIRAAYEWKDRICVDLDRRWAERSTP